MILLGDGSWRELSKLTTGELRCLLKNALGKVSGQDFNVKLGIDNFDKDNITISRSQRKNVKLRHIFYRLVSRDFFTKEKCINLICVTIICEVDVGRLKLTNTHYGAALKLEKYDNYTISLLSKGTFTM